MKVYAGMDPRLPLREAAAHAKRVEALGYDGLHVAETIHDSLAVALLALEHTERLIVRTAVTLAFPRSPTLTAYGAWDLAVFSGGRFQLGLGTQIRQNIEGRYGMPWSEPIDQMRDYLGALAALFASFGTGAPLHYEGDRYRLNRLQPYFNPRPESGGDQTPPVPPIYLGGVNPRICQLAGERADGFITHPTNSNPRYLESVCLPNLRAGVHRAGRDMKEIELVIGTQVITGPDRGALDRERERQRRLLAFLYSTPAYRPSLELYGWGELTDRLGSLVRAKDWEHLGDVITDDVIDTLVPTAVFEDLAELIIERFGDLGPSVIISPPPDQSTDGAFAGVVAALQAA